MNKRLTIGQWRQVDWSKNNTQLAKELGRSYDTVAKKRWLLKVGAADSRAQRKDKGLANDNINMKKGAVNQPLATKAALQSPISGRFDTNLHAKEWVLMSPDHKVYRIKNLHNFVRKNPHLFNEFDVTWKRKGGGRGTGGEYCNATAGLSNVRSGKSSAWKGWRLIGKVDI